MPGRALILTTRSVEERGVTGDQASAFGELLCEYRRAAGLTQEALAERAGLSVRGVSDLERGSRRAPRRVTVRLLAEALELGPAERARLEQAVRRRRGPPIAGHARFAALRSRLPAAVTSFVGRKRELAEVRRLLDRTRLLTLVGLGGIGKTRLALQVAGAVAASAAAFVDLASLELAAVVPDAVAAALGLLDTPGQDLLTTLAQAVQGRSVLLVLDNCEHVVAGCAELADNLLQACPDLRIVATSREPLGVAGELVWTVPPLAVPEPADSLSVEELNKTASVRLFVARVQLGLPGFVLEEANAPSVADICRRLEGIPLALELAAARVRALGLAEVAGRLDDRLQLLVGGSRVAPARQQALRATLAWSYDLLSEAEQRLFRRLAVFVGGWTLDAAEVVCADQGLGIAPSGVGPDTAAHPAPNTRHPTPHEVLEGMVGLVDKSLVQRTWEEGGETRFGMLETIREYALEQLEASGEAAEIRRRQAEYCLALAADAEPKLFGAEQGAGFARLEREHDNLRAVLRWSAERGEGELGLRLAGALWHFWRVRGHLREGREWLRRLLAPAGTPGRTAGRAKALHAAGFLDFLAGDYAAAQPPLEESLEIRRELGDQNGVIESLSNLGLVLRCRGHDAAARAVFEEALATSRALDDPAWEARILNNLARLIFYQGDYAAARALHEESLAKGRQAGDTWTMAIALGDLGDVAQAQGDQATTRALYEESLALWRELGDERGIAQCLEGIATLAAAQSQHERAVRLIGAALAARERVAELSSPARQAALKRLLATAREALGGEAYAAAWAAGQALPVEQAVACALAPQPEARPAGRLSRA